MKYLKKILPYIIIFLVLVFTNLFFVRLNMDEVWNYGFSYAIKLGEIPYKDFNMVITPFYPFLMTIPLFINNSYLSFVIFHSLLLTGSFFLLYKMYKSRALFLLLFMLVLYPVITPTYNSMIILLLICLLFLEVSKFKYKNILIGIIIMLSILTKQSIGIFFIIPSILLKIFKKEKVGGRIIGLLIPLIPLGIYLFKTHSAKRFIDQCFLSIFSFGGNAANFSIIAIILFILILILSIKIIQKYKDDYTNYYIIGAYAIFIPTPDLLHLVYILFLFILLVINNFEVKGVNMKILSIVSLSIFFGVNIYHVITNFEMYPNKYNHFEYKFIEKDVSLDTKELVEYTKENDVIMFDDFTYLYRIINNQKVTNLDIVNHGNHGRNGSTRLIELLKQNSSKKILIRKNMAKSIEKRKTQTDKEAFDYVINNYNVVGSIRGYNIYEYKN